MNDSDRTVSKDSIEILSNKPETSKSFLEIYELGSLCQSKRQYQKALVYLLKSQSIDKQNSIILEHIGDVYLKLEKYEKALNTYNRIMINNPDNIELIKKIELLNEK